MEFGSRKTAITLLVCVVLAGCAGGIDSGVQTTTAGDVESKTTNSDGSTTTSTGTTSATTTDTGSSSHPLSDATLASDHASVLRDAGNFTAQFNTTIRRSGTDELRTLNSTVVVSTSSGEVLSRLSTTQVASQVTYVAPDGTPYQRMEFFEGASPEYQQPTSGYGVKKYVESAPEWFVNAYDYSYDGTTTVNGDSVHVYSVTSVDQLTDRSETLTGYNPDNVTDIEVRLFVTDSGLVRNLTYRLEREYEGERVTITRRKTYTALGATAVETPPWLDDAKASIESTTTVPDPSREVERTVSDESLGVAVTVKGPKYDIENVELERQTGGIWDTGGDGYREAQVSTLVELRLPYMSDVNVTTFELSYDESAVPAGDEAGLGLYRYNETLQTFVEVDNTVDTEDDVVRAQIDREGTYLVMHTPTWRELFR